MCLPGLCARALPAADFAALVAFGFVRILAALLATAFEVVFVCAITPFPSSEVEPIDIPQVVRGVCEFYQ